LAWLARLLPQDARVRKHAVWLVALLAVAFGIRLSAIHGSLPYPRHPDETTWANIALRMLHTGDMNPHRFRKPSLPVYLMYGGFAAGYVRASMAGDVDSVRDLGTSAHSYYVAPRAAEVPKAIYALASVLALGFIGYLGFLLTKKPAALWLTPLFACVSASYYRFSWSYMNVDIIGAFFALLTIGYLVRKAVEELPEGRTRGGYRVAITAGVLAGLTVGSKYNLFPILVPCVLWFFFYDRRSFSTFVLRSVVVGATSFATFLLTTPYAVLDFGEFKSDLVKEMHHYATGHPGATVSPGFPMMWTYIDHFIDNFGVVPLFLSIVGVVIVCVRDYRLGLVVWSYAAVFVAYMCLQHVFFERNVVAEHLFVAAGLTVCVLELPGILSSAWRKRRPETSETLTRLVPAVAVGLVVLLGLPWMRIGAGYAVGDEPRNEAARWVEKNVDHGATVLVDKETEMDTRPLVKRYKVVETSLPRDLELVIEHGEGKDHLVVISRESERGKYSKAIRGDKARARFARPPDKLGAAEVRAVTILERMPRR
jgi:hypothetical protein